MQWQKDRYSISTDKALLDINKLYQFISSTYWAKDIPLNTFRNSIEGAMCFGLYHDLELVGFARMITDNATFGYLADVFVAPAFRGKGLGKWLTACVLAHPELQGLRRIMLATSDAHSLYAQFGFTPLSKPESIMQIHDPDVYRKASESCR